MTTTLDTLTNEELAAGLLRRIFDKGPQALRNSPFSGTVTEQRVLAVARELSVKGLVVNLRDSNAPLYQLTDAGLLFVAQGARS